MNNFNFGEVLTRAWQIIWKHKILWIFGILASCARGNRGGGGGGGNSGYQTGPSGDTPFPTDQFEQAMDRFAQFISENWWVILVAVIAILLLSFLFFALGMIGRIGLIKGTSIVEAGAEKLAFGELWSESLPYFWRIFGLNFFIGLAFFLILIPFVLFGVFTAGVGFLCLLPLICLLIPISWVVAVITEQAQAAIVLDNLSIMDGIKRGWEVVKSNAMPIFVMSLILFIGGAIVGVVISLPIILAVVPLVIGANALRESLTPVYIALACCALYVPVIIVLNGVLTAYIQSAWTLTYMRLAKPQEETPVFIEGNA